MLLSSRLAQWARGLALACCMGVLAAAPAAQARHDPLSSWNDGPARKAIVEFVKATTDKSGPNYVPSDQRIATFDNSDGDQQMLEYATSGGGKRFGMLVLHDDAKREFACGPADGLPDSKVGTFTQALYDEAKQRGWIVISMQKDWKRILAAQR